MKKIVSLEVEKIVNLNNLLAMLRIIIFSLCVWLYISHKHDYIYTVILIYTLAYLTHNYISLFFITTYLVSLDMYYYILFKVHQKSKTFIFQCYSYPFCLLLFCFIFCLIISLFHSFLTDSFYDRICKKKKVNKNQEFTI